MMPMTRSMYESMPKQERNYEQNYTPMTEQEMLDAMQADWEKSQAEYERQLDWFIEHDDTEEELWRTEILC